MYTAIQTFMLQHECMWHCKLATLSRGQMQTLPGRRYRSFFHHYQGSIDFNTVNIRRTVGMYFLVSTGNRGDIE